jgi:histidinol-phosphate aminotransferase
VKGSKRIDRVRRIDDPYIGRDAFIRLDKCERSYSFSDGFMKSLKEKVTDEVVSAYHELQPLYEKTAKWAGVAIDEIYLSSGSEYSIKAVFEALVDEGDTILLHNPGYAMYGVYADLYGAKKDVFDYGETLRFDLEAYTGAINSKHKVAVLENPNGFIGNSYGKGEVEVFIKKARDADVWAVLDEAYFHFCPVTAADLIRKYDNLLVTRTFSKAFGAAGVRLGYLVACKRAVELIKRTRPMHEVTSFAAVVGLHCIENEGEMKGYIETVKESAATFITAMDEMGIDARVTDTNFVLVKWGDNMNEYLKERGMLVRRPYSQPFLKDWTRVTMGDEEQTALLIKCVGERVRGTA